MTLLDECVNGCKIQVPLNGSFKFLRKRDNEISNSGLSANI